MRLVALTDIVAPALPSVDLHGSSPRFGLKRQPSAFFRHRERRLAIRRRPLSPVPLPAAGPAQSLSRNHAAGMRGDERSQRRAARLACPRQPGARPPDGGSESRLAISPRAAPWARPEQAGRLRYVERQLHRPSLSRYPIQRLDLRPPISVHRAVRAGEHDLVAVRITEPDLLVEDSEEVAALGCLWCPRGQRTLLGP